MYRILFSAYIIAVRYHSFLYIVIPRIESFSRISLRLKFSRHQGQIQIKFRGSFPVRLHRSQQGVRIYDPVTIRIIYRIAAVQIKDSAANRTLLLPIHLDQRHCASRPPIPDLHHTILIRILCGIQHIGFIFIFPRKFYVPTLFLRQNISIYRLLFYYPVSAQRQIYRYGSVLIPLISGYSTALGFEFCPDTRCNCCHQGILIKPVRFLVILCNNILGRIDFKYNPF